MAMPTTAKPATIPAIAPEDRPGGGVDESAVRVSFAPAVLFVPPPVRKACRSFVSVVNLASIRSAAEQPPCVPLHGFRRQHPRNGGSLAPQVYHESEAAPTQSWAGRRLYLSFANDDARTSCCGHLPLASSLHGLLMQQPMNSVA